MADRICAFAVVRMKHHGTACERRESLRISAHPRRTAGRVDTARATPRRQGGTMRKSAHRPHRPATRTTSPPGPSPASARYRRR